jgi:uncharacterized membrane protein YccC
MEVKAAKGYVFHRDHLSAARTALGAFSIILSGCLIWIYSAWPDGATAVSVLGVCCTLFASFDTPAQHLVKYIIGSVWGVLISLFYSFVLLPQVTDFAVLVAVLAPAYLLAGSLQARPPSTFMAMGITLTLPILCELGAHYSGDFAGAINTSIALFAAIGFAVVSMSLLQTVQADAAINRLLKLCRRDIRRSVKGVFKPDEMYWTNLMIDRTAFCCRVCNAVNTPQNRCLSICCTICVLVSLSCIYATVIRGRKGKQPERSMTCFTSLSTRKTFLPYANVLRQ